MPVDVIGAPRVVLRPSGPAVAFNGRRRAAARRNPLEGLSRFTIEVLFSPDADGPEEQRFLHIQEAATENRAMVELRLRRRRVGARYYLRHGDAQLTLLDRAQTHAAGGWHVATLTFDGQDMAHYVDGVRRAAAPSFHAARRGPHVDRRPAEPRVVVQGPHPHGSRHARGAGAARFLQAPARVIPLWPEGVPGRKADAAPSGSSTAASATSTIRRSRITRRRRHRRTAPR